MSKQFAASVSVVLLAAFCGCRRSPPAAASPSQTVAESYCSALLRNDTPAAYAQLDAESRKRCPPDRFAQLLPLEIGKFGFAPAACRVQSCAARGATAIAHVVFTGPPGSNRRYQDAITLRRIGNEWKIVLPEKFGLRRT
jgi:hypothetical protein